MDQGFSISFYSMAVAFLLVSSLFYRYFESIFNKFNWANKIVKRSLLNKLYDLEESYGEVGSSNSIALDAEKSKRFLLKKYRFLEIKYKIEKSIQDNIDVPFDKRGTSHIIASSFLVLSILMSIVSSQIIFLPVVTLCHEDLISFYLYSCNAVSLGVKNIDLVWTISMLVSLLFGFISSYYFIKNVKYESIYENYINKFLFWIWFVICFIVVLCISSRCKTLYFLNINIMYLLLNFSFLFLYPAVVLWFKTSELDEMVSKDLDNK